MKEVYIVEVANPNPGEQRMFAFSTADSAHDFAMKKIIDEGSSCEEEWCHDSPREYEDTDNGFDYSIEAHDDYWVSVVKCEVK